MNDLTRKKIFTPLAILLVLSLALNAILLRCGEKQLQLQSAEIEFMRGQMAAKAAADSAEKQYYIDRYEQYMDSSNQILKQLQLTRKITQTNDNKAIEAINHWRTLGPDQLPERSKIIGKHLRSPFDGSVLDSLARR